MRGAPPCGCGDLLCWRCTTPDHPGPDDAGATPSLPAACPHGVVTARHCLMCLAERLDTEARRLQDVCTRPGDAPDSSPARPSGRVTPEGDDDDPGRVR